MSNNNRQEPSNKLNQKVKNALLKILYERNRFGMPAMIAVALIFYFNLRGLTPGYQLEIWFTIVSVMVVVRFIITRIYLSKIRPYAEYRFWANIFIGMCIFSGCLWGFTVYFISLQDSIYYDAFQVFMLAGVTASSIHMLASIRTACLSFLALTTIPYFIYLVSYADFLHYSFAALIVLYWFLLVISSLTYHKIMVNSIKFSYVNADLVEDLLHQKKILTYFSTHDLLTHLPNRGLLRTTLEKFIQVADQKNTKIALLFLDLDKFKKVNDSYGHKAGDELLIQVAGRIKVCLRPDDFAARISGDEFVVLLTNIDDENQVHQISQRLCESLSDSFKLKKSTAHISVSIGVSLYPTHTKNPSYLLQYADTAMYAAKEQGRNNYQLYTEKLGERLSHKLSVENNLIRAIENQQLLLHYQPIINLNSGKLSGLEALLRLQEKNGRLIMPNEIIPSAEDSGLIVPVGYWEMEKVCTEMKNWNAAGLSPTNVAINLSAHSFRKDESVDKLASIIRHAEVDPQNITIELTESSILDEFNNTIGRVNKLHDLGVKVSLDDFGMGYSSFNYLKKLSIDKMKIADAFIQNVHQDAGCASIVSAMISMAHDLNIGIIAEGVENLEQLEFLVKADCDEVQGYLFSYPLPLDEITYAMKERDVWLDRRINR